MDPMAMPAWETAHGALSSDSRPELANKPGFFLGSCGWTGGQEMRQKSPESVSVYSATSGALSVLSGRLWHAGPTGPC